ETNVCTFYPVTDVPADSSEPFPIGRACANTEVCVVTERNELARRGEVGELYVRGPSLMKGYWGDPEKTKRVLVSHPVPSPLGEEIVYRTGDLVIQAPDGNYVFLGRRDNMIKSRGYRIELGEIESALYSHPEVEEAAVIGIPDEEIGNQIKAVVVIRNPTESAEGDLRSFCAERIPKYMIPGIVEFRSALPKTSTGKIDKTRLRQEHLEGRSA
ncbi:MAG TPA: AMP-binding protein, partial [Candidatus Acidoferrum sp.]|nr:AMP-binding protein [Candidatus Acidoferrum sp.]